HRIRVGTQYRGRAFSMCSASSCNGLLDGGTRIIALGQVELAQRPGNGGKSELRIPQQAMCLVITTELHRIDINMDKVRVWAKQGVGIGTVLVRSCTDEEYYIGIADQRPQRL